MSGVFGGTAAPYERWTFRLNLAPGEAGADLAALAEAARVAFNQSLIDSIRPHARLTEIKTASIGVDGKYLTDPVVLGVDVGGNGQVGLDYPSQVALAVSLGTERRGATGRGRFYLPAPAVSLDFSTGQVFAAQCEAVRANAAFFLTQLNTAAGFGNVVVASSKGYLSPVTSVRVGRVLDTIRSRRTDTREDYTTEAAVALSA